jgi:uncharacterized membrane protein
MLRGEPRLACITCVTKIVSVSLLVAAQLVTALGCALIAGLFFAFSSFVMSALSRLPPEQGIAAMQSINIAVINPVFLVAFFGTGTTAVILAVVALASWQQQGTAWVVAGAVLYAIGVIVVTRQFNVPLNNALATAAPTSAEGAALWRDYLVRWTNWNHVRTVAALAAAGCFTVAIYLGARGQAG